ncbi:hypothetical protein A7985_08870 [Pseudoalteromonas luteoviolacea]|uniref:YknX-like C-terminal permuted SH3-like domain-containing protein n=1 Tax=Pseudoalteromonas luteoviolacea TaxID=43657 RepID=A0A1C0TRP1_9GAMM|nr:efflux RND transporter periplasmic adaptor subunit [Pseudoalteromonas luteoviolacea]OCQ21911.1 hypothetical protein A7985_08870 [Pseudoalteromonas luteoviolacea]
MNKSTFKIANAQRILNGSLAMPFAALILFSPYLFAQTQPKVAVEVKTVSTSTIYDWAFSEGLAQGIRREYLNFETDGKITFIAEDQNGIDVRAGSHVIGPKAGENFGQLLARVDERKDLESVKNYEAALRSAQLSISLSESRIKQAENNYNLAKTSFERTEAVWKQKLIPKEQYESSKTELLNAQETLKTAKTELANAKNQEKSAIAQLNQAKLGLEKTSIFAPFDGVLRKVNVREGDFWAGPSASVSDREKEVTSAMVVVDNSQYEVTLNVPYYAAGKLKENQPVYISWSAALLSKSAQSQFGDELVAHGKIFSVSPSISLEQRAIEVKVHTNKGAELLKDGMHVMAWILVDKKEQVLMVPDEAMVVRNNKPYVFVEQDGKAKLTKIETGIEGLDNVEVISGLSKGMKVITVGKHKLVDGTEIRLVQE